MAAVPKSAPAQPQASGASASAAASGRGLRRTASLWGLGSAPAVFAELQQPAPQTLGTPATRGGEPLGFPWSLRASRYGPSQVVPAPPEESQHPDSRRSLLAAQQRQQSAQPSSSLAKRSIFARVAVIGNRRVLPEQQRRGAAGLAASQEEPQAALVGASASAVPSQPQPENPECSGSLREPGMAAATDNSVGDGPGSGIPTRRGSR